MKIFLAKWKNFIGLKKDDDANLCQLEQEEPPKENPIPNQEEPSEKPKPEQDPNKNPSQTEVLVHFL